MIDEQGGVMLGVDITLSCPTPPDFSTLRGLVHDDFDGAPVQLRLVVTHGDSTIAYAGKPGADSVVWNNLFHPPPPPPPHAPPPPPDFDCSAAGKTFEYTGGVQTYDISEAAAQACKTIGFIVVGGGGGDGYAKGGKGATVTGWYRMSAVASSSGGTSLRVYVGAQGAHKNVYSGNGGGASAVTSSACGAGDRSCVYVVAGGGGGGANGGNGGDGGQNGASGGDSGGGSGGRGATQSGVGAGGGGSRRSGGAGSGVTGGPGSSACGNGDAGGGGWGWAHGGRDRGPCGDGAGGAGGGGWYGGGGGGGGPGGAAGGGGSSMLEDGGSLGGGYGTHTSASAGSVVIKFCQELTSC